MTCLINLLNKILIFYRNSVKLCVLFIFTMFLVSLGQFNILRTNYSIDQLNAEQMVQGQVVNGSLSTHHDSLSLFIFLSFNILPHFFVTYLIGF